MFARWLVMFPLLRCNNSHIWLTVLSCSIKRQMFNSDGDKLGYILLIVSSLLFSFFWYAARAVKRFSLDCSPIMFNRELVFSSGLFSLNNSANANSSSFFIWRRFKSISSSSFSKLLLFSKLLILLCKDLPNKGIMVYMMMTKGRYLYRNGSSVDKCAIYAVPDDVITGIMADRIAQVRAGSDAALAALGDLPPERLKRMKEAFDAEAEQTITRMVRNARAEAAQKLLGITHGEMTSAVTTATGLDTYARDDAGQLIKSFMLFKTTPFAGFRQLVNRANDLDTVPALKFLASYIAGTTLAGMFANQMNSLLTGNDPLDMTKPTTWVQALLKGGSFGIYGDFLFQDHTQYGSSIAATIGGPVLSFAEQLTKLLITNPQKALQGKKLPSVPMR